MGWGRLSWGRARFAHLTLFAAGVAACERADAGAWTPAAGTGQSIVSLSFDESEFADKFRAEAFGEYGLGDGWALSLKAETEYKVGEVQDAPWADDRSSYRAGVQKSFAVGPRASVGVQASYLAGEALEFPECVGDGYELRAMGGVSFNALGREGFVNIEAGHRERSGCSRNIIEGAAGLNLTPKWRVIVKGWREEGERLVAEKVEASLYRDFGGYSLGLGYREEVSGLYDERGITATLWTRF